MPMYTFVCHDCAQPFDQKLSMSQSGDVQACPTCGSLNTRKSIGAIAVGGTSKAAMPAFSAPPVRSPFS